MQGTVHQRRNDLHGITPPLDGYLIRNEFCIDRNWTFWLEIFQIMPANLCWHLKLGAANVRIGWLSFAMTRRASWRRPVRSNSNWKTSSAACCRNWAKWCTPWPRGRIRRLFRPNRRCLKCWTDSGSGSRIKEFCGSSYTWIKTRLPCRWKSEVFRHWHRYFEGGFFIGWKMSSALFSWIFHWFLYCLCCKYNRILLENNSFIFYQTVIGSAFNWPFISLYSTKNRFMHKGIWDAMYKDERMKQIDRKCTLFYYIH